MFIPYIQKDVLNADSGLDLAKITIFNIKIATSNAMFQRSYRFCLMQVIQEPFKAIKFFSGMLSNQTLNRETQSIIVLMAMILENNDLAAPILILQLLKVATVVGSVEVRIYTHVFIDVLIHFFHHSTWFSGVLNRTSVHCWAIGRSRSNRTRPMWIH